MKPEAIHHYIFVFILKVLSLHHHLFITFNSLKRTDFGRIYYLLEFFCMLMFACKHCSGIIHGQTKEEKSSIFQEMILKIYLETAMKKLPEFTGICIKLFQGKSLYYTWIWAIYYLHFRILAFTPNYIHSKIKCLLFLSSCLWKPEESCSGVRLVESNQVTFQ